MIRIINYREAQSLVARKTQRLEDAERIVAPILEDVRREGDAALLAYARKFDGFEGASVRIPVHGSLEPEFGRAVRIADANIREYARLQLAGREAGGVSGRPQAGPDRPAARFHGRVHARGPLSAAFHAADEHHSGAGGRRQNHLRRLPASQRRDPRESPHGSA